MTDDALLAVPYRRAADIVGISLRQLNYWAKTGLVVPSISDYLTPRTHVRLYTFQDMIALLVVAQLREQLTLQHIRRVVDHLRSSESDEPLRELRFAIRGDKIYFQRPDGTWSGEDQPRQLVADQVLALEPLAARVREGITRPAAAAGKIVRRRGVHGSKPIFAGTRVPVSAVLPYIKRGMTDERILDAFPVLTHADIEAARRTA